MNDSCENSAEQIARTMRRLYDRQLTTTSGGNISVRDAEGNIWITPGGTDKGNLMLEDIVKIRPDGTVEGRHRPSLETPVHLEIYRVRPDVHAIVHAHPAPLLAYSLADRLPDINLLPQPALLCRDLATVGYACPGSDELLHSVSVPFQKGAMLAVMKNHGAISACGDLDSAYQRLELLNFCAMLETEAARINAPLHRISDRHMEIYKLKVETCPPTYAPEAISDTEKSLREQMCSYIARACRSNLFSSTQGSLMCRLDEHSFLITPAKKDRNLLVPDDLVRIDRGRCEDGKSPSRSMFLADCIFRRHPLVQCMMIASPLHIMSYVVTDREFSSERLAEAYMMLRTVKRFPFGTTFMQPALFADEISPENPVALIENDCALAVGPSLLSAYDRMEVLENSAKAGALAFSLTENPAALDDAELIRLAESFPLKCR